MTANRVPHWMRFGAWCIAWLALCVPGAWAEDVIIHTQPNAATGVTVVSPPETQQVTVTRSSTTDQRVEHEAVVGFGDEDQPATSVIVKTAPPAPRQQTVRIETRPAEDAVWIPGYWRWDTDRNTYEWVPGVWRRAVPGMTWHQGHWAKTGSGYQWMPGYWVTKSTATTITSDQTGTETKVTTTQPAPSTRISSTQTGSATIIDRESDGVPDAVIVRQAPPEVRVETAPASPGADYVWIAGHWEYRNNEYVWIGGRWERPSHEGMMWVPPRWVKHADDTYTFVSGHWDYPPESRTYIVSTDLDRDNVSINEHKREETNRR